MAKTTKAVKATKAKAKPALKKISKPSPAKKKTLKPAKKTVSKVVVSKGKKEGSRRLLNDAKIAKLQKMYKSGKYSAQNLCEEFGISMATLFNYLKVEV